MAGVSATTDIRCDREKVFEYLSDPTLQAKWMPSIEKVEHTEGPSGQVGARYRQTVTMMGQTQEGALEIVESQPPTRFRTCVKGGPATIDSLFELSTESGATRVKMTVEARPMLRVLEVDRGATPGRTETRVRAVVRFPPFELSGAASL